MIDSYLLLALGFLIVFGVPLTRSHCRSTVCTTVKRVIAGFTPEDTFE